MRKALLAGLLPIVLSIAGCGGGGISAASTSSAHSGQPGTASGPNVVTMTVDSGPVSSSPAVDTPYITVTVCVPGSTTQCQTFNDIEVDTGSYGFRILADATDTSGTTFDLSLPAETAAGGAPLAECAQFVDGFSWGLVTTADLQVGGETASDVPVQVIGDPTVSGESSFPAIPAACSSVGTSEDTVTAFGANGILGIGPFAQDCGSSCAITTDNGDYYVCPAGGCQPSTAALTAQVTNPVFDFQIDNDGVIVELPSLGPSGTAPASTGALIFGIGTRGNNQLNASTILTTNNYGDITTLFNGQSLPYSYFDTGSNAYYFNDSAIPDTCMNNSGWFCPSSTLTLKATNEGVNGTEAPVTFLIANAQTLFNEYQSNTAFDDIGASAGNQSAFCPNGASNCAFDFGLPFFFGRDIYIGYQNANTSVGPGPFYAY
ncbi:MAG: DUF3443 domain-containing protein [Steroidobacteraceae bacterium]